MFFDIKSDLMSPHILKIFAFSIYGESLERAAQKAKSYLENDNQHIYGWLEDGVVKGVCGFIVHDNKIEIINIAVDENVRGQGIGRMMVFALRKKYDAIIEAETDDDAIDFYRKCGFETISFQKHGVRRWTCTLPTQVISCSKCGKLSKKEILLYNESLRKQTFDILPILPTCKRCGTEVAVLNVCKGGNVIVLNGTCGSGKSTIAEILIKKGYKAIDGDCAIQVIKHKKNANDWSFDELANEIACEIDILSLFSNKFVISSVLMPEDMDKYIKAFESRKLKYTFVLLKPEYQTAVSRCQSRTCHTSVTPEEWIKHFYDSLEFDDSVTVIDNTNMTANETADYILQRVI